MGAYLVGFDRDILDTLIKIDLSGQEIRGVLVVIRHQPISPNKIAGLLGCSKTRCSQIVKKKVRDKA